MSPPAEFGERAANSAGAARGPLLVATDGSVQSDAAVRMAHLLSRASGQTVRVLAVVQAAPVPLDDPGLVPPPLELDDERKREMLDTVTAQIAGVAGPDANWPIEIVHGHPPRTIVRFARAYAAPLIVLGLGRHRMLDRLIGSETAVQVLRLTTIPVLAVPPGCESLPRRAVAAVDFSELSVAAVRTALGVLEAGASFQLVHVNTGTDDLVDERPDASRLERAWDDIVRQIGAPEDVRLRTLTLSGAPGRELLSFARGSRADLIVAGTHGRGIMQRLVLGSVATQLLRGAECSVLVTPLARGEAHATPPPNGAGSDDSEFAELLERFTRRNAGRRCSLEVDDPELGAQEQTLDYPFMGAAYDPHDRRVELMLGDGGAGGRHLTRSIGAITRLDVLEDPGGWDRVLRVVHGRGQTLLTFAR
jgi:nucleotide-binding universal stress UspA family protein